MLLSDYQASSTATAIYPQAGTGSRTAHLYCRLGLVNEAGEVAGKVKKMIRDDDWASTGAINDQRREAILAECGDVLWYLSQFCTEMEMDLPLPVNPTLIPVHLIPAQSLAISYVASHLCAQADVSEHVQRLVTMLDELCRSLGSTLGQVAEANHAKLSGRAQRGTLGGDGDVR